MHTTPWLACVSIVAACSTQSAPAPDPTPPAAPVVAPPAVAAPTVDAPPPMPRRSTVPQPPREALPVQLRFIKQVPLAVGGEIGKVTDGQYRLPNGLYALPLCPFASGKVEVQAFTGITSQLTMVDERDWVIAVIATRIRAEYPKDDRLLVEKILPDAELHASSPGGEISHGWKNLDGTVLLQEVNQSPSYGGRDDLAFLGVSYGTSNRARGTCRIDRHFVKHGYYVQLVTIAHRAQPPEDACPAALELADWTLGHMSFAAPADAPASNAVAAVPGDPNNLLGLAPAAAAPPTGPLDPAFVGAWAIERYDNVLRDNIPPWGMINMVYLFHPDGRAASLLPGRDGGGADARPLPDVAVRDRKLHGYLGLTIDEAPATIELATADRLRLQLGDGSVLALRRIAARPELPEAHRFQCAPLTVRGSYDRAFTDGIAKSLQESADARWLEQLLGSWATEGERAEDRVTVEFLQGGRYRRTLRIPRWTTSNGQERKEYGEPITEDRRYELYRDILTIFTEDSCNPARIRFSGKKLEMSEDGKKWLALERSS